MAGDAGAWVLRPAPEHEAAVAVDAVARCLGAGRRALVIVPEAAPVPGTATAIAEAFGETEWRVPEGFEAGAVPDLARRAGRSATTSSSARARQSSPRCRGSGSSS